MKTLPVIALVQLVYAITIVNAAPNVAQQAPLGSDRSWPNMGKCQTTDYEEAVQTSSMTWYGTLAKVGQYTHFSNEYACPAGGPPCPLQDSYAMAHSYSLKVGAGEGFNISLIAAQISKSISFTTTYATAGFVPMSLPPGVHGYQGFATKWVEVKGHYFKKRRACCKGATPECTTEILSKRPYDVHFPRTVGEAGASLDGHYTICSGRAANQKCAGSPPRDMEECKAWDTIIPDGRLEGCRDNGCYDSSKMLASTNNVNRVVIHINGKMCVYGTRDGVYANTWCMDKEMDPGLGPFYGVLQRDGKFCLFTKAGLNYYCAGTGGTSDGSYRMIMQNDGDLVVYTGDNNPIWHSDTGYGQIPFPSCNRHRGHGGGQCLGGNPGSGIAHGEGACCVTASDCETCCTVEGMCSAEC
ncbi:hypothetical protein EMPS_04856 [Entomortierella parvispora]|uniref:Bulb-type lectin domain-containing protein n=1 Tax=Entomortierella parvispora TaxID=205924 RepID=A0A9P3H9Z2_9FUNG|nr:hypothetical protein EMPS_04856 [Entomortierella parvispora]